MHIFSVQNAFTQNLHFSYFHPMFTVQWLSQIQFELQFHDQHQMYYVWVYFGAITWESVFPPYVHSVVVITANCNYLAVSNLTNLAFGRKLWLAIWPNVAWYLGLAFFQWGGKSIQWDLHIFILQSHRSRASWSSSCQLLSSLIFALRASICFNSL